MRSIASRGGNGLEWINESRDPLKLANASGYGRAGRRRFFLLRVSSSFFFIGFVRFVRPVASLGEGCSFISAAVVVAGTTRATVQRCGSDSPDEENTTTRCEWACKTVRIFSTRTRCNPQHTARPTLFPNLYPPIFFVNNTARLSIRQKYEICMILQERGKKKNVFADEWRRNYRTRANAKIGRRYHRWRKQRSLLTHWL